MKDRTITSQSAAPKSRTGRLSIIARSWRHDAAPASHDVAGCGYFDVVTWLTTVGTFLTVAAVITQPIIDEAIWLYCQCP